MTTPPRFPPPPDPRKSAYREPAPTRAGATSADGGVRAPTVVRRAEPPPGETEESEGGAAAGRPGKQRPNLSHEEIQALVGISGATSLANSSGRRPWPTFRRRVVFLVPSGFFRAFDHALGGYGLPISIALGAIVLVWALAPFWKRDGHWT